MVKANEKHIKYRHNVRQRNEYSKKSFQLYSANIKKGEALSLDLFVCAKSMFNDMFLIPLLIFKGGHVLALIPALSSRRARCISNDREQKEGEEIPPCQHSQTSLCARNT